MLRASSGRCVRLVQREVAPLGAGPVASLTRGGSARLLSTGSSEVSTTVASGTKAAPARRGASWGARFSWFCAGASLSLGLGYYKLSEDIEVCTRSVELSLAELRRDTLDSHKALRKKISQLEGQ